MERHVTFVAVLNIAFGFLGLFIAVVLFVVIVGGGIISGEAEVMTITSIVGTAIGFFWSSHHCPRLSEDSVSSKGNLGQEF